MAKTKKQKNIAKSVSNKAANVLAGEMAVQRAFQTRGLLPNNPLPDRALELLKAVLAPEQCGPVHYPDMFGGKSSLAQFKNNIDLSFSASGDFWGWVCPTLSRVITLNQDDAAVTQIFDLNGAWLSPQLIDNESTDTTTPLPTAGVFYSMRSIQPIGRFVNNITLKVDNAWIYVPSDAAPSSITITGLTGTSVNNAATLSFRALDQDGVIYLPSSGTITLPNNVIKFKLQASSTSQNDAMRSFFASLAVSNTATSQVLQTYDVSDYADLVGGDTAQGVYEEYRTVSQSVLVTYQGSTLSNGGNITGRYLEGGDTPMMMGLVDYDSIAATPGSFEGALKDGLYAVWRPSSISDMDFRSPDSNNVNGRFPSIVFAGRIADPTQTIRLRVITNVEAKTFKSYVPSLPSRVAPHEIDCVNMVLCGLDLVMSNPTHLENIRQFLRSLVEKGAAFYRLGSQFVSEHPDLVKTAISAGTAALAIL